MPLALHIALRFLFKSTQSKPITIFALISILGICFSVMLFLCIDSIVTGLSVHLKQTFIGFEAPLYVNVSAEEASLVKQKLKVFAQKNASYQIKSVYTREFDGLLSVQNQAPSGLKIRTVDQDFLAIKKDQLDIFWFDGFNAADFEHSDDLILLGEAIYSRLQFLPGEEEVLTLTHPFADIGPSGELEPVERKFTVAGVFTTGRIDFDDTFGLIANPAMTAIANDALLKNHFFIFVADDSQVDAVKSSWQKFQTHGQAYKMQSWFDRNQNIFKAMQLEKLMYFVIFIFVVLISCFNLAGVISIFERSRAHACAVLRALGLSGQQLVKIYMTLGFFLGSAGMLLGLAFGLTLIMSFKWTHFSLPQAYGFTELPLVVNQTTILMLLIGTPLVATFVSYFVTKRLARQTISMALRRV